MVCMLDGWQSDFSRNWAREGLAAVDLEPGDIQCGHVGNFVGELFAGQGLLGGFSGLVHPDFDGMPSARHEAACASGSVTILAATAEIEAGRYDTACVVGLEMMRSVSGAQAARNLGSAAWTGHEFQDATYLWLRAFFDPGEEYDRRYGLKYEHLMEIAQINFANGKRGPNAQTRGWVFAPDSFTATEYMAIEHLGLTAPGEAWKAMEDGLIATGGRLPVNPSGRLIGGAHAVGATDVRMALDGSNEVTGKAGGYQVEGARTVQTLNIGGSTTTTVSLVIGR